MHWQPHTQFRYYKTRTAVSINTLAMCIKRAFKVWASSSSFCCWITAIGFTCWVYNRKHNIIVTYALDSKRLNYIHFYLSYFCAVPSFLFVVLPLLHQKFQATVVNKTKSLKFSFRSQLICPNLCWHQSLDSVKNKRSFCIPIGKTANSLYLQ